MANRNQHFTFLIHLLFKWLAGIRIQICSLYYTVWLLYLVVYLQEKIP